MRCGYREPKPEPDRVVFVIPEGGHVPGFLTQGKRYQVIRTVSSYDAGDRPVIIDDRGEERHLYEIEDRGTEWRFEEVSGETMRERALRDRIASQALAAMIGNAEWNGVDWKILARRAYNAADAMMEARDLTPVSRRGQLV